MQFTTPKPQKNQNFTEITHNPIKITQAKISKLSIIIIIIKTYIISFRDCLEFGFSIFLVIRVLIRMPFHSKFPISFLEIIIFCISIYLKDFIVIYTHESDLKKKKKKEQCVCVKEISKWVKNVISGFNKNKNKKLNTHTNDVTIIDFFFLKNVTIVDVLQLGLSPTLSYSTFFFLSS